MSKLRNNALQDVLIAGEQSGEPQPCLVSMIAQRRNRLRRGQRRSGLV